MKTKAAEAGIALRNGQSAVIAEVTEDGPLVLDAAMKPIGGSVFRRDKNAVRSDSFTSDQYDEYLYPCDYRPYFN
jgi:hypothetical protein